jgi:hypothetical protein
MGRAAASPRRIRRPVFFSVSGFACVSLPTAWIKKKKPLAFTSTRELVHFFARFPLSYYSGY